VPALPANWETAHWSAASEVIDTLKETLGFVKDARKVAKRLSGQPVWSHGTHTFEATVEAVTYRSTDFGGKYEVSAKLDDGRSVRFTYIAKLQDTYSAHRFAGARVQVTAEVNPWAKDETLGFAKRPKVTVLNPEALLTDDEVEAATAAWRTLYVTEGQPREIVRYSCQHGHTNEKAWDGGYGSKREHHNELEKLGHRCGQTVQVMSDVWEGCGEIVTLPTEIRSDSLIHSYPVPKDEQVLVDWFRALPEADKTYLAARKAHGWSDHGYGFDHWAHGLTRSLLEQPERFSYFSLAG
jgi:hypothetical protein